MTASRAAARERERPRVPCIQLVNARELLERKLTRKRARADLLIRKRTEQ